MRVLLVGTLPPRGGLDARRFAREAARRTALGDTVETLSADPLSISHRTASLRGRHLARELRALSKEFDALELRVESGLGLTPRSVRGVVAALRGYQHVTLFMDSPISTREGEVIQGLLSSANSAVFANEADRGQIGSLPAIEVIVVEPDASDFAAALPLWPEPGGSSLQAAVLEVVRRRARADTNGGSGSARASMLVTATDRVHPSFKGSSIWLVKRVIGKTRGAVTKVLRPTPRKPG
jgi:hypothetical protein